MAGDMRMQALCLALLSASAVAEPMADPTQPPAAFAAPAAPGTAGVTAAAADGGFRLQSVLLPKHGKPLAVIGGKTVRLGEKFGDSRLIRVTEREAVLNGPQGIQRLFLTPEAEKRMVNVKKFEVTAARKKETP